jgi:hypothetical protein
MLLKRGYTMPMVEYPRIEHVLVLFNGNSESVDIQGNCETSCPVLFKVKSMSGLKKTRYKKVQVY